MSPRPRPSTWLNCSHHFHHLLNLTLCLSNMGVILGPLSYHPPQTFLNQTLQITRSIQLGLCSHLLPATTVWCWLIQSLDGVSFIHMNPRSDQGLFGAGRGVWMGEGWVPSTPVCMAGFSIFQLFYVSGTYTHFPLPGTLSH